MQVDVTKPVVFLDIDGVLNGGWQHEYYTVINSYDIYKRPDRMGDWVCRSKMHSLFGIFRIHRAQVVIVSSWCRPYQFGDSKEIEDLRKFFQYDNILGSLSTGGGLDRPMSVWEFLENTPELNNWLVIDDSYHLYHDVKKHGVPFDTDRLIACNGRYGIADCQLAEVDDLLRTNIRRKSPYKNTLDWNPVDGTR